MELRYKGLEEHHRECPNDTGYVLCSEVDVIVRDAEIEV